MDEQYYGIKGGRVVALPQDWREVPPEDALMVQLTETDHMGRPTLAAFSNYHASHTFVIPVSYWYRGYWTYMGH